MIKSRLLDIESNRLKYFESNRDSGSLLQNEMLNIFQVSAQVKRINATFKLKEGNIFISDANVLKDMVFTYYSNMFSADSIDNSDLTSPDDDPIENIHNSLSDTDRASIMRPITEVELKIVLDSCSKKKSPGPDGLNYEFYRNNFDCLKSDLICIFNGYLSGSMTPHKCFTDGIITLIPKRGAFSDCLDDYRPISLLNCDYKLFMKIIAERLKVFLDKLIGPGQTACLPSSSCIDNLKDVRKVLTRACETKRFKGCIASIDLSKAFDRVNHIYLWKVLERFGLPPALILCLRSLYQNASSRVLVNGFLTPIIKINSSVRQGCPLSMILFVLYIEPLIRSIASKISSTLIYGKIINVMAFADDIVVLIKNDEEFDCLFQIFSNFSKFASIRINLEKSVFLRFNNAMIGPQLVRETQSLKILGVIFEKTWSSTVKTNYDRLVTAIKATLQLHNVRKLNIIERSIILNTYILSKLWYVAQVFPPTNAHIARIKVACGKFIWNGYIFKVKRNQLYQDYSKGGIRLADPEAKAKALFLKNIFYNLDTNGSFIEEDYLINCNFSSKLTRNAREWIEEGKLVKTNFDLTSTKLLYDHFVSLNFSKPDAEINFPAQWDIIWENCSQNYLQLGDRAKLYSFLNDLFPNRSKLQAYNIGNLSSAECEVCGQLETNEHRIKECPKAKAVWDWCGQIIRNRLCLDVVDLEDILQFGINKKSAEQKAALWLVVKVISFNLRVKEPSLFIFKREIREVRWNNGKVFNNVFRKKLNIC